MSFPEAVSNLTSCCSHVPDPQKEKGGREISFNENYTGALLTIYIGRISSEQSQVFSFFSPATPTMTKFRSPLGLKNNWKKSGGYLQLAFLSCLPGAAILVNDDVIWNTWSFNLFPGTSFH